MYDQLFKVIKCNQTEFYEDIDDYVNLLLNSKAGSTYFSQVSREPENKILLFIDGTI